MYVKTKFSIALTASFIFGIGLLAGLPSATAQPGQASWVASPTDIQDLKTEIRLLKEKAHMMGIALKIDSIKMNVGSGSGDLSATYEKSCTVPVTVDIHGYEATMTATASSCSKAIAMIAAGTESPDADRLALP